MLPAALASRLRRASRLRAQSVDARDIVWARLDAARRRVHFQATVRVVFVHMLSKELLQDEVHDRDDFFWVRRELVIELLGTNFERVHVLAINTQILTTGGTGVKSEVQ